jgi:hypothetical protein
MLADAELSREAARELAHRELQQRAYDQARPSLLVRAVTSVLHALGDLLDRAGSNVPGGRSGLVLVLVVLGVLVALVVVRLRPSRSGARAEGVFADGRALRAAEHRALAERAAAAGDFAEAVRERLRAVVRELEARGVLDPRPGRTADEVAREAGRLVPTLDVPLRRAATTFDEVWYGGRVADAASYAVLVDVDTTVTATRMVLA